MQDLRPNTGQKMNLTEDDLDLETSGSGWVAERASLSVVQLDSLLAGIRHPIPAEKRITFASWLDHQFATTVRDLGIRLKTTGGSSRSGRANSRKLLTRVRDELTKIRKAISKACVVAQGLSPDACNAIDNRLRELGAAGVMQVTIDWSFWRTRGRVHEAFSLIQFACRTSGAVEDGLVHTELQKIENILDDLTITFDDASNLTRDVLERSFDDIRSANHRRDEPMVASGSHIEDVLTWLSFLERVVDNPRIEVKRGRDEAILRSMVRGLAALYHDKTGEEPARTYYNSDTNCGDLEGEAGDFLPFVKAFTSYVYEAIPHGKIVANLSMVRFVRDVIEERKAQG